MSDQLYAQLIEQNMFPRAATRQALSDALFNLTGVPPRMLEPWNPGDTGCRDTLISFRDADTPQNPYRLTNPGLTYQGFIETDAPSASPLHGWPVPCRDNIQFYRDTNA